MLTTLDLPINDLRGQCFDGASNVSRVYNGLQAKIRAIESRVLFVHCQAHSLNLVTQVFMKNVIEVRDILQLTRELIMFIVESPKRLAWFKTIQEFVLETILSYTMDVVIHIACINTEQL